MAMKVLVTVAAASEEVEMVESVEMVVPMVA